MMGTNASTPAPSASSRGLPECGSFVRVRQRRWLVEQCEPFDTLTSLDLACVEDDAQGERLTVVWEAEPDARSSTSGFATHGTTTRATRCSRGCWRRAAAPPPRRRAAAAP